MSPSFPARGLLALIQLYKWTLSPLIGRECRYLPTCSSYAADAVRKHGAWAGSWMAGARLCRCHPWGGHGWDPAPELKPHAPWFAPWILGDWKGGYRTPADSFSLAEKVAAERPDEGRADPKVPDAVARPSPPAPSPLGIASRSRDASSPAAKRPGR